MKATFAHDNKFPSYNEKFFGNDNFNNEILNRYTKRFDSLNIICRSQKLDAENKNLIPIDCKKIVFTTVENPRSIKNLIRIYTIFKKIYNSIKDSDHIIVRLPSTIGLMTYLAAKMRKIPVAIEVVGNAYEAGMFHSSLVGKITSPFENWLMKICVSNAENTIYITENYLQKIYPTKGKYFVCINANITPAPAEIIEKRIEKIKSGEANIKLGLIGSLNVNYKGHATAIKSLFYLINNMKGYNFTLEFLGGGIPSKWIKLADELGIKDNVKFIGPLQSGNQVLEWIDKIDILIQPSLVEAQGRSIIEGLSRGCPVVASTVGGIPEVLDSKFLSDPHDPNSFSRCIEGMLTDREYMSEIAQENWKSSQKYDKELVEKIRDDVFNRILK